MQHQKHNPGKKTDNFIKMKNFCASEDTINKMKRQSTDWEKIFANHMSDKGLVSRMQNPVKDNNNKWSKDLNRLFTKDYILMANKHEKMLNIIIN